MLEVKFYDVVDDALLKFAVIIAKHNSNWVICKHKERDSYEVPGGHREPHEDILETAKRELYEETGAIDYDIMPICIYSVTEKNNAIDNELETFGKLYYADIKTFGQMPDSEMEKVILLEELPTNWTYPLIQPKLIEKVKQFIQ